jgi:hypothetical protein
MFIESIGWLCTALILVGYYLNSQLKLKQAITVWIIGDIGWIIYDIYINNWSHATLSLLIIGLNLYGIYNIKKGKHDKQKN